MLHRASSDGVYAVGEGVGSLGTNMGMGSLIWAREGVGSLGTNMGMGVHAVGTNVGQGMQHGVQPDCMLIACRVRADGVLMAC